MRAICVRCGGDKPRAMAPCPTCEHLPAGEERALSYLLSSHHLDDDELDGAAARVRAGERPTPPGDLMDVARAVLTASRPGGVDELPHDPGMEPDEKLFVLVTSLLLTPLMALAAWYGWREQRPRAAKEALNVFWPVGALSLALWLGVMFR